MKKYISIFFIAIGLGLFLGSCEKNDEEPIYDKTQTVSPQLLNPGEGDAIVWTEADSLSTFSVSWKPAVYTTNDGSMLENPSYTVTLSFSGVTKELFTTSDTNYAFNVPDLNTTLVGAGLLPGQETGVVWIVTADLPNAATTVFSNEINTRMTTYKLAGPPPVDDPCLYVPGAYQGWDPANAPKVWDADKDGIFEGYVYITGDDLNFKFASQPNWDGPNYGTDGTEFGLDTDPGAGNLTVPAAGGYWLVCNTNDMVYSYELQNFGVIGSGILNGDWTEDVDMLPAEGGPYNILEVTIDVSESADGDLRFKYRANDAWDLNYGADNGSDVLINGGDDILMPEGPGNYTFKMLWDTPTPRYELIKN